MSRDYCGHTEAINGAIYCDYFDFGYMLCTDVTNCPEEEEEENCTIDDCMNCEDTCDDY